MIKIVQGLTVYEENIKRNLTLTKGLFLSEAVMIALVGKGMGRQQAHELVRDAAMHSFNTGEDFANVLLREGVSKYMKEGELAEILKPEKYTGLAAKKALEIVKKLHEKQGVSTLRTPLRRRQNAKA